MEWIIKQGQSVYTHARVWGADAPMIFLDKQEAQAITTRARAGGYKSTTVIENTDPYSAWQLAGFRKASAAVKDYGCEITQEGVLCCASVNGGPELQFVFDDPQIWRLDVRSGEQRTLNRTEILYQFEQDTPIARWLELLWGYPLIM